MAQAQTQTDPWVEAAKNYKAAPQSEAAPASGNGDWKIWQENGADATQPDTRNGLQKTFDELTTVTPEQEQKTKTIPLIGPALNQAQKFGAGAIQGAGSVFVHPEQTLEGLGGAIMHPKDTAVSMGRSALADPAGFAGNLVGGAVLGDAVGEGAGAALRPLREAALGNPDEAAMRGLHVSPQSPRALRTLSAVEGSRPFLQGVKGLEDLQNRVPMAKQEIWAPYEDTLNQVGGKQVTGPNGPTTLRDLENRRLEISAQLRALKSGGPEAMALAQQKGLTQAGLLQEESAIKGALDPHLRSAGVDPEAIRKSFGQVSSIGGRVAGKTTLGEAPIPTGFGRMTDIKLDNPRSWIGEPVRGARDILARRPLWSANPTDMNIREAFRAGGPKPNFMTPIASAPKQLGRGPIFANAPASGGGGETMPPAYSRTTTAQRMGRLLGSGPIELPGQVASETPAYTPTSRAERIGLLLPEQASGKTPLEYQPEMSGGERVASLMHELRRSPQRALPRKASPFVTPPPQ
jgi:hypothetical protein